MLWAQLHSFVSGCAVPPVPFAVGQPLAPSSGLRAPAEDHVTRVRVDWLTGPFRGLCLPAPPCSVPVALWSVFESGSPSPPALFLSKTVSALQRPPRPTWILGCATPGHSGVSAGTALVAPTSVVKVLCLPARDHGVCSHLSASLIPLGRVCGFQCVSPPGLSLFLRTLLFLMLL